MRHRDFLDGLLEELGVTDAVTLVVHDWGSALGFDWARRHPGSVRAIAYMEAIVRPLAGWQEWPEAARSIFQALRSPAGEDLILDRNVFVERILPASILRTLSDAEMDEYRRPFAVPGDDRLPTLIWPRQIPIGGEAAPFQARLRRHRPLLPASTGRHRPSVDLPAQLGGRVYGTGETLKRSCFHAADPAHGAGPGARPGRAR